MSEIDGGGGQNFDDIVNEVVDGDDSSQDVIPEGVAMGVTSEPENGNPPTELVSQQVEGIGKKPFNYWDNPANIEKELRDVIAIYGDFPSGNALREMKKSSLAAAISTSGGVDQWKTKLGYTTTTKAEGYWHDPSNVKTELQAVIDQIGHFPTAVELRTTLSNHSLVEGIMRTGGFRKWQQELGFAQKNTEAGYWTEDRIRDELSKIASGVGHFPSDSELLDQNPKVRDAMLRNGGSLAWRSKLGYEPSRREPNFWKDPANIEAEARKALSKGIRITHEGLREGKLSSLAGAVSGNYPGGLAALQAKLEVPVTVQRVWSPESVLKEAAGFVEANGDITRKSLMDAGRGDLYSAVLEHGGGMNELRQKLGLDMVPGNRPDGYWTPELIESQAQEFLIENGALSTFAIAKSGKADLAGAISNKYPGGINGLRQKFGLEVKEASRPAGYWMDTANIEMEAKAAFDKGVPLTSTGLTSNKLSSLVAAINANYPGGIVSLREKLGLIGEIMKPKNYWNSIENIEAEARRSIGQGVHFSKPGFTKAGFTSLAAAITRNYPGGWAGIKEKLGVIEKEVSISPDEADAMMRQLEIE